jgi:hypothetical protein
MEEEEVTEELDAAAAVGVQEQRVEQEEEEVMVWLQ